jgi:hypothetical protein
VVQGHARARLVDALGVADLIAAKRARNLLGEDLLVAELCEERLVEKILDVLGVVKGGGVTRALSDLGLVARLARVYAWRVSDGKSGWSIPLKMQRRRKSGSEIWSLRTAWVLVM